jgi:hypothetical protein
MNERSLWDDPVFAEVLAMSGSAACLIGAIVPLFVFPGIGIIVLAAWLRNRNAGKTLTEGEEEAKKESSVREPKWPRWLVAVSAGIILVFNLPFILRFNIPIQEFLACLRVFILLPVVIMILSAYGLFSGPFLIGLVLSFSAVFFLEGDPVGPLRLRRQSASYLLSWVFGHCLGLRRRNLLA